MLGPKTARADVDQDRKNQHASNLDRSSHRLQVLRSRRRWSPGRGRCDIAIAEETFASARIAVSAAGVYSEHPLS